MFVLAVLVLVLMFVMLVVSVVIFRRRVMLVLDMLDAHDTRWWRSLYPAAHGRKAEAQERQDASSCQH